MFLGDVIYNYRQDNHLTMKDFSLRSGLSVPYISQLEKNLNPKTNTQIVPSIETFMKAAEAMHMSIDHLMSIVDENQPVGLKPAASHQQSNISNSPMRKVPIYGSIHAGTPCGIDNNRDGEMIFPQDFLRTGYDYVSLRVHGDSMEPEYRDGDVVLIRLDTDIKSGDICSVFINGEDAVLKKVLQVDGGYILQPLNSNYEPMFFTAIDDSTGSFRIHGIVDGLFRR